MKVAQPTSSNQLPPWQRERAKIVHRICQRISARIAGGESQDRAVKRFARRWNGRPFKCAPGRRLALSIGRLHQLYRHWRLHGQTPAALQLHYCGTARRIAAPVLIRFVNFCAARSFPSFRSAWLAFCQRGSSFGPGRFKGQPLKLGYDALAWNLPKGCFTAFKRSHKARRQAEAEITALRIRFAAEIMARVPVKLARQSDFQI